MSNRWHAEFHIAIEPVPCEILLAVVELYLDIGGIIGAENAGATWRTSRSTTTCRTNHPYNSGTWNALVTRNRGGYARETESFWCLGGCSGRKCISIQLERLQVVACFPDINQLPTGSSPNPIAGDSEKATSRVRR